MRKDITLNPTVEARALNFFWFPPGFSKSILGQTSYTTSHSQPFFRCTINLCAECVFHICYNWWLIHLQILTKSLIIFTYFRGIPQICVCCLFHAWSKVTNYVVSRFDHFLWKGVVFWSFSRLRLRDKISTPWIWYNTKSSKIIIFYNWNLSKQMLECIFNANKGHNIDKDAPVISKYSLI